MAFKKKYTSTSTLHHKIQQQLGVCLWAEEVVEVGGDCVVAYEKWIKYVRMVNSLQSVFSVWR